MGAVTELIKAVDGCEKDSEELFALLYHELREIARKKMTGESPGHTLQPTALVNEVILRLCNQHTICEDRLHFLRVASEAMRRILIENARFKKRIKRGGGATRVPLMDSMGQVAPQKTDLLDLHEALCEFEAVAPEKAELVRLHTFCGLTIAECAELLSTSKSTAERHWRFARAWLKDRLQPEE